MAQSHHSFRRTPMDSDCCLNMQQMHRIYYHTFHTGHMIPDLSHPMNHLGHLFYRGPHSMAFEHQASSQNEAHGNSSV